MSTMRSRAERLPDRMTFQIVSSQSEPQPTSWWIGKDRASFFAALSDKDVIARMRRSRFGQLQRLSYSTVDAPDHDVEARWRKARRKLLESRA